MTQRTISRRTFGFGLAALGCMSLSGCSLFLMGQRVFFGDPLVKSEFKSFTNVDLTKGKHKLLILCTTPQSVDEELSTLSLDLIDGVTRQLKREGVDVIDPDRVASWLDQHDINPNNLADLARTKKLRADYIAWVDIQEFTYREDHRAGLLQGKARGFLKVYRVAKLDDDWMVSTVFQKEFSTVYPPHQPISEVSRTADSFRRDFTHRVCDHLAHKFYDYREGWDI